MVKENILIENKENLRIIKFNNVAKRNALNMQTYKDLTNALNRAAVDDTVTIVALTGIGQFYSAGNDISGAFDYHGGPDEYRNQSLQAIHHLVKAFYQFPKILIAVVNGPCIGIAATTAALCDIIYCSDKAYFYTPFTSLGLCPEGCSSYTFPRILGKSKASEMLLLNYKMFADEALRLGFVSAVYKSKEFENKIWNQLAELSKLPKNSLIAGKKLMSNFDIDVLESVSNMEINELRKRFESEESYNAIIKFLNRSSKL